MSGSGPSPEEGCPLCGRWGCGRGCRGHTHMRTHFWLAGALALTSTHASLPGSWRACTLLLGWLPTLSGVLDFPTRLKEGAERASIRAQISLLNAQMFHRSSFAGGLLLGTFVRGECSLPGTRGMRRVGPWQTVRGEVLKNSHLPTPLLSLSLIQEPP